MEENANSELPAPKQMPWNKGKLTGAKPPLRQKHVWAIRTKLQIDQRTRDLALFNLAIDSKLRGCDVVALKVEDVAPNGYCADRATVRQKKTGRPVRIRHQNDCSADQASGNLAAILRSHCRCAPSRRNVWELYAYSSPKLSDRRFRLP